MTKYEELFYSALRIRMVEEKIAEIYYSDVIQSPVHLSIGQEHSSVGVINHLEKDDLVFSTYRGHANYLAKGGDLKLLMAELFGKFAGFAKGKAGSMHLASKDVGVMGSSAVVASTLSHSVGAAYALKLKKDKNIAVVFFGEGATGAGVYHETLNMARSLETPLLLVCEFNDLAIFTKFNDVHSYQIENHAHSYGIETERVDEGWDLLEISKSAKEVINKIRSDSLPRLLLINTCRYSQHVGPGDDSDLGYRNLDSMQKFKSLDPLINDMNLIEKFSSRIAIEIEEAIEFAENSPFPDPSELLTDI